MQRLFALLGFVLCLSGPAFAQVDIGFGGVSYDAREPIEVTADGLTVDQATGEAVFTGNVIVIQGDLRMSAGAVRVVYATDGGDQDVREVIATGGVLVTRGADAAEGGQARFDVASSLLTLSGNVLVTQGPTAIAGDSMVVNMQTGNGSVDGRVRTILGGGD
ncbi:LptA/OstA family protein [Gymnodinialimonas hymeniacidonis]|uniref:LptA/OstA family protein n=1 Tax=Gymnodinialimonas hymeniacidonis TaxID=3126508 RepID=UPI0034C62B86